MSFLETIMTLCKIDKNMTNVEYRATLFGSRGVYIEGVRQIISYSDKEIILKTKKGNLTIQGEKLEINSFCEGDVSICGSVLAIRRNE